MRRRRVAAQVALLVCSLWSTVAASGAAAAQRRDEAAVRVYVELRSGLVHAETATLAAAGQREGAWAAQIRRACGGVLAGAPMGHRRTMFKAEISGAALATIIEPGQAEIRRYAASVSRLRWRQAAVARLVQREAKAERAAATLATPSLCSDARRWANSGFTGLPRDTLPFVAHFERLLSAPEPQMAIQRRIAKYETPSGKRLMRSAIREEKNDARRLLRMWAVDSQSLAHAIGLTE